MLKILLIVIWAIAICFSVEYFINRWNSRNE